MKKTRKAALRTLDTAELAQAKGGVKIGFAQIRMIAQWELAVRTGLIKTYLPDGL
jgi:hypothetical protein